MRRLIRVLASAMLFPMQNVTAQSLEAPVRLEGEKVRLRVSVQGNGTSNGTFGVKGTVASQRGDTLQVIEGNGRLWNVPVANVQALEISQGKDPWLGARKGMVGGAMFGVLMSLLPIDCTNGYGIDCKDDGQRPTTAEYWSTNIGIGVFVGAVFGYVIGSERWESVTFNRRVSVVPSGSGVGFNLKF